MRTKLQVDLAEKKNSDRVAERLALPTFDNGVSGSNPSEGEVLSEPKRRFIANVHVHPSTALK